MTVSLADDRGRHDRGEEGPGEAPYRRVDPLVPSPKPGAASARLAPVEDLGAPTSYLEIGKDMAVYSSDGERLGVVEYVLADRDADIFDGVVLDTSALPGGRRFVDAPEVEAVYERGITLKIDAEAARALPEPSANPGSLRVDGDDLAPESGLQRKLKRAWDLISGNY